MKCFSFGGYHLGDVQAELASWTCDLHSHTGPPAQKSFVLGWMIYLFCIGTLNNLLKRAMEDVDIPKKYCRLYRFAVNFNLNWLFTGKDNIDLNKLYKDNIIT